MTSYDDVTLFLRGFTTDDRLGGKRGKCGIRGVLLELRVANPTHVLEPGDEAGTEL
jgi:hypothetical protein